MLAAQGHRRVPQVRVSRSAHVIMPYHVALDRANETRLGGAKVGTTGRGIGPAYGDRAWRARAPDGGPLRPRGPARADRRAPCPTRTCCSTRWARPASPWTPLVDQARGVGRAGCASHLDDTTWLVQDALRRGDHVLLEGAQGTLLDLDHGSYPFVTSLQPGRGRRVHRRRDRPAPGRRGHRRDEGLLDPRRLRAVPDRAVRRHRPRHRRARPRVRHRHRPPAAGGLVRRRPAALRGRRELEHRRHAQQARHPVGHRDDPPVRRPTRSTARRVGRLAVDAAPPSRARRRSTRTSRAGSSRSTTCGACRTCPRPPVATCRRSRSTPGCRSCSSRSGPSGPRPSSGPGGRSAIARRRRPERGDGPMTPRDAHPHPRRRRRRAGARARVEARPRAGRERGAGRAGERRDRARAACPGHGGRPARPRGGRRAGARARRRSSSSSVPRRRWRSASPTRCGDAGIAVFGPDRAAAQARDLQGVLPRGRRGGGRSHAPGHGRSLRARTMRRSPSCASSTPAAPGPCSRPTASPRARA